jgi:hypothetical protein
MYDLDLQEKRGEGDAGVHTPFLTVTKQSLCGRSVFLDMLYVVPFSPFMFPQEAIQKTSALFL